MVVCSGSHEKKVNLGEVFAVCSGSHEKKVNLGEVFDLPSFLATAGRRKRTFLLGQKQTFALGRYNLDEVQQGEDRACFPYGPNESLIVHQE